MSQARATFTEFVDDGWEQTAAALVALAEAIENNGNLSRMDNLSHGIALGIRKGLFGCHAEDSADIRAAIYDGDDR